MGKLIDLSNQRFGRLVVIGRAPQNNSSDKKARWICKCDCGNIKEINGGSLRRGSTQSCGCLQKEKTSQTNQKDLSNQRFGRLIALYRIGTDNKGNAVWKCKCDCGNEVEVSQGNLHSGNTQSCGCINSKGESKIASLLLKNNIKFIHEYSFPNSTRRFDFAILNKNQQIIRLIEFDGIQHYIDLSDKWDNKRPLSVRKEIDKEKNKIAKEYNIPLIRIPYWDYKKISIINLLDDTYLVKE